MKIVYCEPNKRAVIKEIEDEPRLETWQSLVDGYIEVYYPSYCEDGDIKYLIVCNEEGKFNGMWPCRVLINKDSNVEEVIYGPFVLVKDIDEDFGGFTDEEAEKLRNVYDHTHVHLDRVL